MLVISAHSVVCDRTAAWIHGIDVYAWHETEILPPIESSCSAATLHRGDWASRVGAGTRWTMTLC